MSTIQHMEPELDYGGEYYSDSEEEEEYEEEEYYEEEEEEEVIEEEVVIEEEEEDELPPSGGMAAMIAAAASKRNKRIDKGGDKVMRKESNEVKAQPKLDLAAQVALKASKRNDRIEKGGEAIVRVIPEAHKTVFVDIASEAASVGRLTRLNEHAVEATALAKEEKVWGGPSGLRTDHIRSHFMIAVNEAAALGQMKGRKAHEVTNYDQNAYVEEEEPEDIDKMVDEHGRSVMRTEHLLDRHLEEARKEKEEDWAPENLSKTHPTGIDDVVLPDKKAPAWKPKPVKEGATQRDLMDSISLGVAERAWERNYRLGRPKALLRVTRKCKCKYCVDPNPFQTHKYKQMHDQGIEEADNLVMELPEDPRTKPWKPPKRTPPPREFAGFTPQSVAPAPETNSAPSKKKLPFKVKTKPPKPIKDNTPEPEPEPQPQDDPDPAYYEEEEEYSGPEVLLEESKSWSRPREKPKKDGPSRRTKSSKRKGKKKETKEGCAIM